MKTSKKKKRRDVQMQLLQKKAQKLRRTANQLIRQMDSKLYPAKLELAVDQNADLVVDVIDLAVDLRTVTRALHAVRTEVKNVKKRRAENWQESINRPVPKEVDG